MQAQQFQVLAGLREMFCPDCMKIKSPTCCRTSRVRIQFRMRRMRRLRREIIRELKEAGKIP